VLCSIWFRSSGTTAVPVEGAVVVSLARVARPLACSLLPFFLHCFSDSFSFIAGDFAPALSMRAPFERCPRYSQKYIYIIFHSHHTFTHTHTHTHTHTCTFSRATLSSGVKPAPTASEKRSMKACRATNTTKTWHFRCSEAARAARSRRGPALGLFLLDLHALPSQALPAAVLVVVFLQSASIVSGFSIGGP
jgi:hypothetical protein